MPKTKKKNSVHSTYTVQTGTQQLTHATGNCYVALSRMKGPGLIEA